MKCALCLQDKELRNSHILPKFLTDWFIATSPTGYIRESGNPNLRQQDGEKRKLLCHDCEQLFSKWEDKFAREIFYPYVDSEPKKTTFSYGQWLEKFIISVVWRYAVTTDLKIGTPTDIYNLFPSAIQNWHDYLLHDVPLVSGQHIFFMNVIDSIPESEEIKIHPRFNTYVLRSIYGNFFYNTIKKELCVYIKLPSILLFSFIKPKNPEGWEGTKVEKNGRLNIPQHIVDNGIFQTMLRDAKDMFEAKSKLSEKQEKKIITSFFNSIERMKHIKFNSSKEAWEADTVLQQKLSSRKIGRNDTCFCGSGKKYKKCHYL